MSETVLLAAFTAVEGAHAFSAFLPSIHTIRHFADARTPRDIRAGEAFGGAFCLALGFIVSRLSRSPWPFIAASVTGLVMISVYEWALRTA